MEKFPVPRPERESYVKHRRDVTRQILLPVILASLAALVIAVLAGLAATQKSAAIGLWADISIIWLIIPIFFLTLVILAVTLAMVYGLNRLLKVSPYYTGMAQTYALWLSTQVKIYTDKFIDPVLYIKSWLDMFVKSED
jgi:hypothetical protein